MRLVSILDEDTDFSGNNAERTERSSRAGNAAYVQVTRPAPRARSAGSRVGSVLGHAWGHARSRAVTGRVTLGHAWRHARRDDSRVTRVV
eukprot:1690165-Rhodomonas_salina.1